MDEPIKRYPDEPHPDNEFEWKKWWVMLCFRPDDPVSRGALAWIDQCWRETKARWHVQEKFDAGYQLLKEKV